MIEKLKDFPEDAPMQFDYDDKFAPGMLHSYRGYYEDLAVEPVEAFVTVANFRVTLQIALGKIYHGYKGGEFTMDMNSTVWVSDYGCHDERYIFGFKPIEIEGETVIKLLTGIQED